MLNRLLGIRCFHQVSPFCPHGFSTPHQVQRPQSRHRSHRSQRPGAAPRARRGRGRLLRQRAAGGRSAAELRSAAGTQVAELQRWVEECRNKSWVIDGCIFFCWWSSLHYEYLSGPTALGYSWTSGFGHGLWSMVRVNSNSHCPWQMKVSVDCDQELDKSAESELRIPCFLFSCCGVDRNAKITHTYLPCSSRQEGGRTCWICGR